MTTPASSSGNLLALDTATDVCSVALRAGGRVSERVEVAGNRHSELLLPMVDSLLEAARVDLPALQAIAFGAGPGSFTGLRIACSVAQGLGWACDLPLVPIGNLEALAHVAFATGASGPAADAGAPMLVAIDARMEEAYWALFAQRAGRLVELHSPALARRTELTALARHHGATLAAGDAWTSSQGASAGIRFIEARATARAMLDLAAQRVAEGRVVPPAAAAPLYVRDRVALTVAERAEARKVPQ